MNMITMGGTVALRSVNNHFPESYSSAAILCKDIDIFKKVMNSLLFKIYRHLHVYLPRYFNYSTSACDIQSV